MSTGTSFSSHRPCLPAATVSNPIDSISSRKAERYRFPSAILVAYRFSEKPVFIRVSLASDRHFSSANVALKTRAWVCTCGSRSREVSWLYNAATILPVSTVSVFPSCVMRALTSCSTSFITTATARLCASIKRRSSPTSAMTDTLLGAENVRS